MCWLTGGLWPAEQLHSCSRSQKSVLLWLQQWHCLSSYRSLLCCCTGGRSGGGGCITWIRGLQSSPGQVNRPQQENCILSRAGGENHSCQDGSSTLHSQPAAFHCHLVAAAWTCTGKVKPGSRAITSVGCIDICFVM